MVRGDSGAAHGQRSDFFYQGGYCGHDLPSRAADILPVTSLSSGATAFLPDCSYFDVCDIIAGDNRDCVTRDARGRLAGQTCEAIGSRTCAIQELKRAK